MCSELVGAPHVMTFDIAIVVLVRLSLLVARASAGIEEAQWRVHENVNSEVFFH